MIRCYDYNCEYMQLNGYCSKTACIKPRYSNYIIKEDVVYPNNYEDNCIIFPQTIGNITFYTKKELIDWVLMQQDENYGIGNWC